MRSPSRIPADTPSGCRAPRNCRQYPDSSSTQQCLFPDDRCESYTKCVHKLHKDDQAQNSFQCCFTLKETIRTFRVGEPRTATSTFTQLLSCECVVKVQTQRCFTSTENVRTPPRDGEPRMAALTFTQLLSFAQMMMN